MRKLIHKVLNKLGLELRLIRNVQAARQAQRDLEEIDKWRLLRHFNIGSILDVGANEGQFAAIMLHVCPLASIYSFEPLPDVHSRLVANFASTKQVIPVALGLGDENCTRIMNRSGFSPSSSMLTMGEMHRMEWPKSAEHTSVEVRVQRLDDWVAQNEFVADNDLLVKMDVQGFELAVIDGGEKTIRAARVVVVEVSFYELYEGQPLFSDIHARMASLGFIYRGSLDQHYSRQCDKILFADAVFENLNKG